MRRQDKNPAYRRFKHLLPQSGLYPAKWVDIFSNADEDLRYEDVEVVFIPRGVADLELDRNFWAEFADYNGRWLGDLGNSVAGWMERGGLNPEKVFGVMLWYGFTDKRTRRRAVEEFASIEECEWARQILKGEYPGLLETPAKGGEAIIAALRPLKSHRWAKDMAAAINQETDF